MRFGSVCSGIEAASVAWHHLGWEAAWFAEVDRAASELLAYRFPHVTNHGDMTTLAAKIRSREIEAPDILVGGTPCQSFSVAGLRGGLKDARGQLTLAYIDLANAIDEIRLADGLEPCIIVWENVPGVLSHNDNPLGCFLAGLAGDDDALEPGPRPEPGRSAAYWTWDKKSGDHRPKWPNAGAAVGPERAVAWVVKDAQFFRLAQRRRRVFVVASAREGFDPAGILLEFEGVRRDSAPSREKGQNVAGTLDARTDGGGFPGTDGACSGHVVPAYRFHGVREGQERNDPSDIPTRGRLRQPAVGVDLQNIAETGDVVGTIDTGMARGNRGYGVLEPVAFGGGNQSGQLKLPTALTTKDRCDFDSQTFVVHGTQDPCVSESTAFALGRNSGGENVIAFTAKDYGGDAAENLSPTLRSMGHSDSHANGGGQVGVAYSVSLRGREGGGTAELGDDVAGCLRASGGGGDKPHVLAPYEVLPIDMRQASRGATMTNNRAAGSSGGAPGTGIGDFGDPSPTISTSHPPAVCVTGDVTHTLKAEGFDASEDGTGRGQPIVPVEAYRVPGNVTPYSTGDRIDALTSANDSSAQHILRSEMAVRRLMPVECERLQGFPDGWTLVPNSRGKLAADGPRYKQLGNSMAVNVMRWIGYRIADAVRPRGHNGGPPLDDFDSLLADDFEALL